MYPDIPPQKLLALRVFVAFSVLLLGGMIVAGVIIGESRGYGTGPWNGRTVHSCYTPGGPYYLEDVPKEDQPCPSSTSTGVIARKKDHGR